MNHFDFVVEFLGQMNELLRPIDHFLPARGGLLIVIRDRDDLVLPSDSSYTGFQSKRPSVLWPRARPFCFDCPKNKNCWQVDDLSASIMTNISMPRILGWERRRLVTYSDVPERRGPSQSPRAP